MFPTKSIVSGGPYQVVRNYVINLDRSVDRLNNFTKAWAKFNMEFERFPGVDGSKLSYAELRNMSDILYPYWDAESHGGQASFSPAEVGVGLSHAKLWQKISALPEIINEFDLHCIFEDAGVPSFDDYDVRVRRVLQGLPRTGPIDILYLLYREYTGLFSVMESSTVKKPHAVTGATGYCLSRKGARKFVSLLPVKDMVQDDWMGLYHLPARRVSARCAVPPLVRRSESATTIFHWNQVLPWRFVKWHRLKIIEKAMKEAFVSKHSKNILAEPLGIKKQSPHYFAIDECRLFASRQFLRHKLKKKEVIPNLKLYSACMEMVFRMFTLQDGDSQGRISIRRKRQFLVIKRFLDCVILFFQPGELAQRRSANPDIMLSRGLTYWWHGANFESFAFRFRPSPSPS